MRPIFFTLLTILIPMTLIIVVPSMLNPHCETLDGYNKNNATQSTGNAHTCLDKASKAPDFLTIIIFLLLPLPLLGIMQFLYLDDNGEDQKKLIKKLETEIPNVGQLEKIPCALCGDNVDRPYNLIKHLGVEQTKQYLSFCDETKTEPTLYCCKCYAMVERSPNWQRAMDSMIDDSIKYRELKKINLIKSRSTIQ